MSFAEYISPPLDLIDIHTLGALAFTTPAPNAQTLQTILESAIIPKAFFDVRKDSDALYAHFNINLAGIVDIQLMELATRSFSKRHVNGLAKCMAQHVYMTTAERQTWVATKEKGKKLFAPELGGNYEVFNVRPMLREIKEYCAQDVRFLPQLWKYYNDKMSPMWAVKVEAATKDRVKKSQAATFIGQGRHMALGPW